MKILKSLYIFLAASVLVSLLIIPNAAALEDPGVKSSNVVLVDTVSNTVFYTKDADARVYPASLTKIMTVLLAVEACENGIVSPDSEVTASENIVYDLIDDGSTVGIVPGETMTLKNLMYCAMVKSANEACNVIAEYIGGTIPAFIDMMNDKARELGCTGTQFKNTHGIPDESHYTTAWDMYLIASEAMTRSLFAEICDTVYVEIPATNVSDKRYLVTTNGLLSDDASYSGYFYENAKGVKTGFTSAAGYCLVSTAERDGLSLMAVVMGGVATDYTDEEGQEKKDYSSFSDSIKLYEWGFNNFSYQDIIKITTQIAELPVKMGADANTVKVRAQSAISALLPNDVDLDSFKREIVLYSERDGVELTAPITAGEVLGEITLMRDGEPYGKTHLVASTSIELSKMYYIKSEIDKALDLPAVKVIFWSLVVLFAAYLVLVIRYRVRRVRHLRYMRKMKKERAREMAETEAQRYEAGPYDDMSDSGRYDTGRQDTGRYDTGRQDTGRQGTGGYQTGRFADKDEFVEDYERRPGERRPGKESGTDSSDDDFLSQLFK